MVELKTSIHERLVELLVNNVPTYEDVEVYPKNQVAPRAKYPYIEYDYTHLGWVDKNENEGILDIVIVAKNNKVAQLEAENIGDIFTIEGNGFQNETLITSPSKLALEFRSNSRGTPESTREKIKTVAIVMSVKVDDPRSIAI